MILYLDFETSGLDPNRHSILQAAWILEKDGEVVVEHCYDVCPDGDVEITFAALDINGFTIERIKKGKSTSFVLSVLKNNLIRESSFGVDLAGNSIRPCGHNVGFDLGFLNAEAKRCGASFYHLLDFRKSLDTLAVLRWMDFMGAVSLIDYKLETVCEYYGIPLKPHDALEDVRAVRKLLHLMKP